MTCGEYALRLEQQGGQCLLAELASLGSKCSKGELFAEHDHVGGFVRGLVCHNHNVGIAKIGDCEAGARIVLQYFVDTNPKNQNFQLSQLAYVM